MMKTISEKIQPKRGIVAEFTIEAMADPNANILGL